MPKLPFPLIALLLLAALLPHGARAEKADRLKQIVVEGERRGLLELNPRHFVVNGNVLISQGSMLMRAEQADVRETPDGYLAATLSAAPGQRVSLRQKREGLDEFVEGSADRIEYEGKLDTVRLVGNAVMRVLHGTIVTDEVSGALITYNNLTEVFSVDGGSATKPGDTDRFKMTFTPRGNEAPASKPAGGR